MTGETVEKEIKGLFRKYPSIENAYQQAWVDRIRMNGYENEEYLITEKIHGGNTQIAYDIHTKEFEYCKRTCKLQDKENFYNVSDIFDTLKEKVVELSELLLSTHQNLHTVRIYGEVFGGSYPHKEIPRNSKASKVQKGVYYTPNNEWLAFDISYTLLDDPINYFLSGKEFLKICEDLKISHVPVLQIAKNLSEALAFPNNRPSIVHNIYNLPELEDNIMEGVVIRGYNKDLWSGQHRVIIKNKNERFAEKSKGGKPNVQKGLPERVQQAQAEIAQYITENRVNNIISHIGEVTVQDIGKVLGLTSKDILEEYNKQPNLMNTLEKEEQKLVTKFLNAQLGKLVKEVVFKVAVFKE